MELTNLILNFLLLFSNDILLMLIANMIYIFSKKDDYQYLILLLLFVMIFKTILKDIFKIPPPINSPSLNYAFPSGHIYFTTGFYSWITFYKHSLKFGMFALAALILTSFAIIFKNYHGILGVIFTFLLAILTVFAYSKFSKLISKNTIVNMFVVTALALYLLSLYIFGTLKIDAMIGLYGTLGFVLGLSIKRVYTNFLISILGLVICYLFAPSTKEFIEGLRWYFIFFIPPCIKLIKEKSKKYLAHF